LTQKPKSNNVK